MSPVVWTDNLLPVRLDHFLWVLGVFQLRYDAHVAGYLGGRCRHCCLFKTPKLRAGDGCKVGVGGLALMSEIFSGACYAAMIR